MAVENSAGRARDLNEPRAQGPYAFAAATHVDLEPRAGAWRQSPEEVVHLGRRTRPVDTRLAGLELLGVGGAFRGLRRAFEASLRQPLERFDHEARAFGRDFVMQLAG